MPEKKLILFDFDGTLTKKDSFIEFIVFYYNRLKLYTGFLANGISLIKFFSGRISNSELKEHILAHFFRGISIDEFNKACDTFALDVIPKILRKEAINTINTHKKEDNRLVVVTASCSNWIRAWTNSMNLELIATELEVVDGKITGRIKGKNCYGPEKEKRIKLYVELNEFDSVIAYGDSAGDQQMLDMADIKYYRAI